MLTEILLLKNSAMKIYSTHRNRAAQAPNTLKNEIIVNWQRAESKEKKNKRKESREDSDRDTWADLVARRIQTLGEKLSEFFMPEVVE